MSVPEAFIIMCLDCLRSIRTIFDRAQNPWYEFYIERKWKANPKICNVRTAVFRLLSVTRFRLRRWTYPKHMNYYFGDYFLGPNFAYENVYWCATEFEFTSRKAELLPTRPTTSAHSKKSFYSSQRINKNSTFYCKRYGIENFTGSIARQSCPTAPEVNKLDIVL